MFEEQMRALEQQQAQELLSIPVDSNGNSVQHMAASAPTTPPRVNALLSGGPDVSPTLRTSFARMGLDTDVLSRAVGSVSDKRKSVTYAPVARSPEIPPSNTHGNNGLGQGYGRAGAKSLPASRRTSASSHDDELAGHLQGLSIAGASATNQEQVPSQKNGATRDEESLRFGSAYNAGMMLDEQLDEEMNSEYNFEYQFPRLTSLQMPSSNYQCLMMTSIRRLTSNKYAPLSSSCAELIVPPLQLSTSSAALDLAALSQAPSRGAVIGRASDAPKPSEWPQFSESPRPDHFIRDGRRVSTNPTLSISDLSGNNKLGGTVSASATPHLPAHGQVLTTHIQTPSSRRGSPLGLSDSMSITTRSVPATPLAGISNAMPAHLTKTPGTPISPEAQTLGARLTPQSTQQLGDSPLSSDLQSSLSRLSGHSQYDNFDSGYDDPLHVCLFLYILPISLLT